MYETLPLENGVRNMDNINWEFLEVYKSIDELCKQILSSDRGISEYIDEMNHESQGRMMVACWEKDYNQLKKMRWIRNQLVHEVNSSQKNLVTMEEIEWLKTFRSRILECTDPFSLLRETRNIKRKTTVKQDKPSGTYSKTSGPSHNTNLLEKTIISIGIALAIVAGIGILGIVFCLYFVLNKF